MQLRKVLLCKSVCLLFLLILLFLFRVLLPKSVLILTILLFLACTTYEDCDKQFPFNRCCSRRDQQCSYISPTVIFTWSDKCT
ncbi:hypothetical protein GGI35DRAFT_454373 [Trichoderma velutinum]